MGPPVTTGYQVNSGVWMWISDHGLPVAIGKKGSRFAWPCLQTGLYASKSSRQGCEGDLAATSVIWLIWLARWVSPSSLTASCASLPKLRTRSGEEDDLP